MYGYVLCRSTSRVAAVLLVLPAWVGLHAASQAPASTMQMHAGRRMQAPRRRR